MADEPFAEDGGELCLGLEPLARRPFPFLGSVVQNQIQQLHGRIVIGEVSPGSHGPPQLRVQRLDGAGGVDDPAHALGEGEEGHDVVPVSPPAQRDRRIALAPVAGLELLQRLHAGRSVFGPVDGPQRRHDGLSILPRHELKRMADQMHDAGLDDRLGKDGADRFGKALQPVDDGDQDVAEAAALQLVHHP